MIAIIPLLALAFLYYKGWIKITYTGATTPIAQLSFMGLNIAIRKPDASQQA